MFWFLLVRTAWSAGGALVGAAGVPVPSAATQLSIAPGDAGTTFVISAEVSADTDAVALLWPMPGIVPSSVEPLDPLFFARIEPFTRARVETFTCDELVTTVHWATPPGCASYEVTPPPVPSGETASDAIGWNVVYAEVGLEAVVVAAEALPQWLVDRGLALAPEADLVLQEHLLAGDAILAVHPLAPMTAGTWLPPVRFSAPTPTPLTLPLGLGAAVGSGEHLLVLYGVGPAADGALAVENYPRGYVEDDCMLPAGATAAEWWTAGVDALRQEPLPTWALVHATSPDTCQPCVTDPMEAYELGDYGSLLEPADAVVSRVELRFLPSALDEDPVVGFDGVTTDAQLRWIERDVDLGFAFGTCGEDGAAVAPGVCEGVDVSAEQGCATSPTAPFVAVVAGLLLVRRRRRWGAALLAAVLLSRPGVVLAADRRPIDRGPRAEAQAGVAVFGTDRVLPAGLDGGGPHLLNPYLSLEARWALVGWRDGANVGPLLAISGWSGRAAPGQSEGVVGFTLLEPSLGIDVRHGRFRERGFCPKGRYGASFVLPVLDPSVTPAHAYATVALHGGIGAWLGRGRLRPSVELRARVLPRTDGFETTFHENVGIPGWMFFPGTANLWVMVGVARL